MSRSAILLSTVLATALASASPARADGPPTHAPNCVGAPGALPASCMPPAPRPAHDIRDSTHFSVVPTGNTLPAGEASVSAHEFLLFRGAVGVTDRVELNLTAPIFPVATNLGARLALTDRDSALRITVGAGVWIPMMEDASKAVQATMTVAYQTERTNVHASASAATALDGDGDYVFGYAAGIMHKVGKQTAVVGELLRLASANRYVYDCWDCSSSGGYDVDVVHAAMVGLKLMRENSEFDLGFLVAVDAEEDTPGIPLISYTRRL